MKRPAPSLELMAAWFFTGGTLFGFAAGVALQKWWWA